MTKIVECEDLLKHSFTKCVMDAFQHLDFVRTVKSTNSPRALLDGYSLGDFSEGTMSFEEYFVRNLFKKAENVHVQGVDPERNTEDAFISFLDQQEHSHVRVAALLDTIGDDSSFGRVLLRVRNMFSEIFGDFSEFELRPRFTSGATLSLSKKEGTSPFSRYRASEGSQYMRKLFDERRKEGIIRFSFLESSFPQSRGTDDFYIALQMVPKEWSKLRIIGKGPSSITACQAGLGDWMTYRAKTRVGIDITTAQERHKRLARLASVTDSYLMTADQSEASDRILRVLIKWLMPSEVFGYMEDITPHIIQLFDGTFRSTHMMAPAGNGYIFPLQTILFYCLAKSVCIEMNVRPEVYSYGDDLIAPAAIYTQLHKVFSLLALKVNPNKTFRDGSARESCGGDYVLGSDVRPLYVTNIPFSTTEWYSVINGIRRVGYDNNLGYWRTNNFKRLWFWCISHIQPKHRLFAPTHYGDTAIGTSDYRLYRLTYKRTYVCNGKSVRYPNDGLFEGHPYSGWYIKINATKSAGKGEPLPEHIKGLKMRDILRMLPLDSVKGAGDTLRSYKYTKDGKKLNVPVLKYVYSPFFHRDEFVNHMIDVPLSLECPAPNENMDDLFSVLDENNPIRDTQGVIERMKVRYNTCLVSLIDILKARLAHLQNVSEEVESLDLNF